jgi:hypothetical protein
MTSLVQTIRLEEYRPAPVNRPRLARYLELPSIAQMDPITAAEIRKLDAQRDELVSPWQRADVLTIERIDGRWIQIAADVPSLEATDAYGQQLLDSRADALIVAAFTIGRSIDEIIRNHLEQDEVYEAFVLKQWAATMTEQVRAELIRRLRAWGAQQRRSLLPFNGPGYNGWPLRELNSLLDLLYSVGSPDAARPLRATESGVLLPTNSMLIVCGLTPCHTLDAGHDDRLAQCYRCAMPDCRYRVAVTADELV